MEALPEMKTELITFGVGLAVILLTGWIFYGWAYDNGQQDLKAEIAEDIEKHNLKVKEDNKLLDARAIAILQQQRALNALLPKQTREAYESPTANDQCFPDDRVRNIIRPNIEGVWRD